MKHSVMRVLILACLLMVSSAATGLGFDFSELENAVHEYTLDNGLKIIVLPRHHAPVVSCLTWADVGSVDDPKELTGIAHLLEHMAFKGTNDLGGSDIKKEKKLMAIEDSVFYELRAERLKGRLADSARLAELEKAYDDARDAAFEVVVPNEFTETVSREGGVGMNAGTSYDLTRYFFSVPSNKIEFWMAMESERFYKPVLRAMYKERDVVAEERRQGMSTPFRRMMEQFFGLAYLAHPYGNMIVGHMSDIQNYTRDDLKEQFQKYYGPSNLTVAIVGDVDPENVHKLAKKYWGRIKARPGPEPIATVEPEQLGERRMDMEDPAQPMLWMGWHVPDQLHPDWPALEAAMDYLGQGRTSLLFKSLVRDKKVAIQAQSWVGWPGSKYSSMALTLALPSQDHTNTECEEEILAQVEILKEKLVSEQDIEAIKARAKAGFIGSLTGNLGLATQLAAFQVSHDDWRQMFRQLDLINAVTAEDIQRVMKKYFTKTNRVVVQMNTIEG